MAGFNYETVFASAGFAGNSFDIAAGYATDLFTPAPAGDAAFSNSNTITLTADNWPAWMVPGKVFTITSGSTLNLGTFTVVSVVGKVLTVLETTVTEAAQTPVCDGTADTGIISNLLSAGNGVLTADAPLVLYSTGALNAARTLDIGGLEDETVLQGAEHLPGRWFYLSVQNTDISAANKITVSTSTGGGTINGFASIDIVNTGDYLFFHETGGLWRVNALPRPEEPVATLKRVPFTAADWSAGTVNRIVIPQTGALSAGEVGPHYLTKAGTYIVQVVNTDLTPDEIVNVEVQFDPSTGDITLVKAQGAKPFNGVATIVGAMD